MLTYLEMSTAAQRAQWSAFALIVFAAAMSTSVFVRKGWTVWTTVFTVLAAVAAVAFTFLLGVAVGEQG